MKRLTVFVTLAVFLVAANASAQMAPAGKPNPVPKPQTIFSDNFNDGDTVGWYFPIGDWRVEKKVLVQTHGGDWNLALVPDHVLGSQSTEVMMSTNDPAGNGAIYFWRQDDANNAGVLLYPHGVGLLVGHVYEGVGYDTIIGGAYEDYTWYKIRVDADSETGVLTIFVNDVYVATYTVTTPVRSGLTGLHSGNTAGAFDNFRISRLGGGKKK